MNADMQKNNRNALADYLERQVADHEYDHATFVNPENSPITHCAIGHAGVIKLAGFYFNGGYLRHKNLSIMFIADCADEQFGENAWERIFSPLPTDHNETRLGVVQALRNF